MTPLVSRGILCIGRNCKKHAAESHAEPPVLLAAGDSVTIESDGIGRLINPAVEEAAGRAEGFTAFSAASRGRRRAPRRDSIMRLR